MSSSLEPSPAQVDVSREAMEYDIVVVGAGPAWIPVP